MWASFIYRQLAWFIKYVSIHLCCENCYQSHPNMFYNQAYGGLLKKGHYHDLAFIKLCLIVTGYANMSYFHTYPTAGI